MQSHVSSMEIASPIAPAYGALAHLAADNLYFASDGGYLFTCPYIRTPTCAPHCAAIVLTACRRPFTVRPGKTDEVAFLEQAAALGCAPRRLYGTHIQMIIAHVSPLHPAFRSLQAIAPPGLQALDRTHFASLDDHLKRAFLGLLSAAEAGRLYDDIVRIAAHALPRPKPADARAQQWIAALRLDSCASLRSLARESGVSYQHMSRIFNEALGLSLRQFQLWEKLNRVDRVLRLHDNLTDIAHAAGFADLAHMTRVFQRNFGAPPSYFFRNPNVRIFDAAEATRALAAAEDGEIESSVENAIAVPHVSSRPSPFVANV